MLVATTTTHHHLPNVSMSARFRVESSGGFNLNHYLCCLPPLETKGAHLGVLRLSGELRPSAFIRSRRWSIHRLHPKQRIRWIPSATMGVELSGSP